MDVDSSMMNCRKKVEMNLKSHVCGQGDNKCCNGSEPSFWLNGNKAKKSKFFNSREKVTFEKHEGNKQGGIEKSLEKGSESQYSFCSKLKDGHKLTCKDCLNSEKILKEDISQLKERVEFLLQAFKSYSQKLLSEEFSEQIQVKSSGAVFGDVWRLFNFNQRMNAAEEGIEKLALILEKLVKKIQKKNEVDQQENFTVRDFLDFDDMSISQRLEFLKSRNDLLTNFMMSFLKVGTVEDICARLELLPKKNGNLLPSSFVFPKDDHKSKSLSDLNPKDNELSKALRLPKPQIIDSAKQQIKRNERKEDILGKYNGNKLEVILEQSELSLNQKEEDDESIKLEGNNTKIGVRKFSQISEQEVFGCDMGVNDETSRLLAREALLKTRLDKVQLELLSKLSLTDKNCLFNYLNLQDNPPDLDGIFGRNSGLDSSSLFDCIISEHKSFKVSGAGSSPPNSNDEDFYDENSQTLKNNGIDLIKQTTCSTSIQKEQDSIKNKPLKKSSLKNCYDLSLTSPSQKSTSRPLLPQSPVRQKSISSMKDRRPFTAPNFSRKSPIPLSRNSSPIRTFQKSEIHQESPKKFLLNKSNFVRNKNKSILNRKTFSKTS